MQLHCYGIPFSHHVCHQIIYSSTALQCWSSMNHHLAEVSNEEIHKLVETGCVTKLDQGSEHLTSESWFLPHHVVHQQSGKHQLVFNCSKQHQGQALNDHLLPGPILGPSLLGVLLRLRQQRVAVTGDIKAMFHQVRLLPADKLLLRFIWRDIKQDEKPLVPKWQVLPFGTTCSPCNVTPETIKVQGSETASSNLSMWTSVCTVCLQ